jgi:hypothetical protein
MALFFLESQYIFKMGGFHSARIFLYKVFPGQWTTVPELLVFGLGKKSCGKYGKVDNNKV